MINLFTSVFLRVALMMGTFFTRCLVFGVVGTLKVENIIFSDLDEDTGCVAKIRFLPISQQYTGGRVAIDTIRYSPEYDQLYAESTLLIDVPEHKRLQLWTLGPWCTPVENFVYAVHGPRHREVCEILDEDGFLTRGILARLREQWLSQCDTMELKTFALSKCLEEIEDFLDTACYLNSPYLFSRRKSFEASDLMYYQNVSQDENGCYRTVRIRPSNHDYVMDWNNWIRIMLPQQKVLDAMAKRNHQWPTIMAGVEGVKVNVPGCQPMDIFLDPATLDSTPLTNYVSSKLVVADFTTKGDFVFQWTIRRPHGASHEERRVSLDVNVSMKTYEDGKRFREQKIALYKMNSTNLFLTIGPVYTPLAASDDIPGALFLGPHESTFFKRKIRALLQGRNMSFLRYLDR